MIKDTLKNIKKGVKNIAPRFLLDLLNKYKYQVKDSVFDGKGLQEVFSQIYLTNHWKNEESVSGPGSSHAFTKNLIPDIENLIKSYNIQSIIDAPCGDFNWLQKINLQHSKYLGLDIVRELIESNRFKYQNINTLFDVANIVNDPLPKADLIITRDCLVHFSFENIFNTIKNFKKSGSTYLLTTSFTLTELNYNITTGDWRPINLQKAPFHFPPPIYQIEDMYKMIPKKEGLGKILGLWKLSDIKV